MVESGDLVLLMINEILLNEYHHLQIATPTPYPCIHGYNGSDPSVQPGLCNKVIGYSKFKNQTSSNRFKIIYKLF